MLGLLALANLVSGSNSVLLPVLVKRIFLLEADSMGLLQTATALGYLLALNSHDIVDGFSLNF